jgi:hypothetical protein
MITKIQSIPTAEGLQELTPLFEAEAVSDLILCDLTDQDLRNIGIEKLGHRKQILQAIERTKTEEKLFSKMIFVEGGRLPDSS